MRHYITDKHAQLCSGWIACLIIYCMGALLVGCGTSASAVQARATTTSSTTARTVLTPPTPAPNTLSVAQTICPTSGIARPANMPPDTTPAQPAVFYFTEIGGVQSGVMAKDLKRYELATGKTTTIFSFPSPSKDVIESPVLALSPDKHWLLIASVIDVRNGTPTLQLQLMRTDGTQSQTLLCAPWIGTPVWSPDGKRVAFNMTTDDQPMATVHVMVLDLTTGRLQKFLTGGDMPEAWLDSTRLYVAPGPITPPTDLYLLDTSKGENQQPTSLAHITSLNKAPCGTFEPGQATTQLYISSCTQVTLDNCQSGQGLQGPSMISSLPAAGGQARTIYRNPSHAIVAMHVVNAQTILFYIDNSAGDLSQNGLWKINTNGSGLTRLNTIAGGRCFVPPYAGYSPEIASNSQSYAQLVNTFTSTGPKQAIQVDSLTGGAPITIATSYPTALPGMLLVLVGMA
jgi:hypothetical protein